MDVGLLVGVTHIVAMIVCAILLHGLLFGATAGTWGWQTHNVELLLNETSRRCVYSWDSTNGPLDGNTADLY